MGGMYGRGMILMVVAHWLLSLAAGFFFGWVVVVLLRHFAVI